MAGSGALPAGRRVGPGAESVNGARGEHPKPAFPKTTKAPRLHRAYDTALTALAKIARPAPEASPSRRPFQDGCWVASRKRSG